jgi:hypothetical protein
MKELKKILLTEADRQLFGDPDEPDIVLREKSVIGLMHPNSPQLLPGGKFSAPAGTVAGDFLARRADGTQTVYKGATGFLGQMIGVRYHSAEYEPDEGSERGRLVADHPGQTPQQLGGRFLRVGRDDTDKSGWHLGRNRLIPTYDILFLIDKHGYVMSFYKTAEAVGEEIVRRASRLQVKIGDDVIKSPVVAKIQIISELEKKGDRRYFVPKIGRIIKLGESDEIALDEARSAKHLRDAFKAGGEWMPEEPPEPPPAVLPSSYPALVTEPPGWDEPPPHDDADIVDIDPEDEMPL